jgi:hypothetical protein
MSDAAQILRRSLEDYEKIDTDLSKYQKLVTESEKAEKDALNNDQLTDDECYKLLDKVQRNRRIYTTRATNCEAKKQTLFTELERAIIGARSSLNSLLMTEFTRRHQVISERVLTALEPRERIHPKDLDEFLEFSKHLMAIRICEIGVMIGNDVDSTVTTAKQILESFEKISLLAKEEI